MILDPNAPTLTYIQDFSVMGLSIQTQNTDEFNEKTAKLPSLWQQFYSSELATNPSVFEVYSDYESDANGLYTVTVGVSCLLYTSPSPRDRTRSRMPSSA